MKTKCINYFKQKITKYNINNLLKHKTLLIKYNKNRKNSIKNNIQKGGSLVPIPISINRNQSLSSPSNIKLSRQNVLFEDLETLYNEIKLIPNQCLLMDTDIITFILGGYASVILFPQLDDNPEFKTNDIDIFTIIPQETFFNNIKYYELRSKFLYICKNNNIMILSDNRIDNLHYQLRSDLIDYTISNTFTILDLLIEYNISIRNDKNDILNRIQNNIIDEDFTIFNNIHMFCILIELSFNDSLTFNNRLPKADILFYRFVIMLGSKEPNIYL